MQRIVKRLTFPLLLAVLALVLALWILAGIWRSEKESRRSHMDSTTRSVAELTKRHFQQHDEVRTAFAQESGSIQEQDFMEQARDFMDRHTDVRSVLWLTPQLDIVFRYSEGITAPEPGEVLADLIPRSIQGAFLAGRTEPYYSPALVTESGHPVFSVFRPVFEPQGNFAGYLMTVSRADLMIDRVIPPAIFEGYAVELLLEDGTVRSIHKTGAPLDTGLFADVFLEPSRLVLQLTRYDKPGFPPALLFSGLLLLVLIGASGWSVLRIRQAMQARESAERSLYESEERYRMLFNNSHTVMLLIESDTGRIEEANPAALRYYGYGIEEIRKKRISDINLLPHEGLMAEIEKVRSKEQNMFRFHHRLASGAIRDVEVFTGPVRLKGKIYFFSVVQDITERNRLQTELDKTLSLQARILENAFVGILYIRQQRIVWANPVAGVLFGRPHESLVGMAPEQFIGVAGEVEHIRKQSRPLLEAGKPFQTEMLITRKNDDPVWVDIFAKSATATGLEEGSIWVVRDISARKLAEQQMQASLADKEVLLREIHHRVKNNFQVILSLINLKARQFQDAPGGEILEDIASRIRAMSAVHERLYRTPNMAAIDSREYLESVAAEVVRTARSGSGINLETRVEAHPLTVETAIPCGLILTELLANTLKHAYPEGRRGIARVRFSRTGGSGSKEPDHFTLEVSDDGQGMRPTPDPEAGADALRLGLHLVRSLAEKQLGGTFRTEEGAGTCCVVTFPAKPAIARKSPSSEKLVGYHQVIP